MSNRYLLDSWALLAWLYEEKPAAERIERLLFDAAELRVQLMFSVINLGEVFYIFGRARGGEAAEEMVVQLKKLPIQILPVDEHNVLVAAYHKMNNAISYADAFAVAAAEEQDAILLSGDPELFALDGEIQIERLYRNHDR
ncbi:MAG: type II toxin-antitoxin system VapC family toxin [Chloroflexi bacterium]|nr:type II toxin-antitoxin system VapC family toxin [Chloroflexota bacterium]